MAICDCRRDRGILAIGEILGMILRIKNPIASLKRILPSVIIFFFAFSGLFAQRPGNTQQIFLSQEIKILHQNNFTGSLELPEGLFPWDVVATKNEMLVLAQNYRVLGPDTVFVDTTITALFSFDLNNGTILATDTLHCLGGYKMKYYIGYIAIANDSLLIITDTYDNTVTCLDINKLSEGIDFATIWTFEVPDEESVPCLLTIVGDYICIGDYMKKIIWRIPISNSELADSIIIGGTVNSLESWGDDKLLVGYMGYPKIDIIDVKKREIVGAIDLNYGDRPGSMVTSQDTLWVVNWPKDLLYKINLNTKENIGSIDVKPHPTSICALSGYILGVCSWNNGRYAAIILVHDDKLIAFIPLQNGSMPTKIIYIEDDRIAFTQFGKNDVFIFSLQELLTQLEDEIIGPAVKFEDIINATCNYSNYRPEDLTIGSNFACVVYPDQNTILFTESGNSILINFPEKPLVAAFNDNETRLLILTKKGTLYQIDVKPGSESRFEIVNEFKLLDDSNNVKDLDLIQEPDGHRQFGICSTDSLAIDFAMISAINYLLYQDPLTSGSKSAVGVNDTTLCIAGTDEVGQGFVNAYKISKESSYRKLMATVTVGEHPSDLCFLDEQLLFVATQDGLYSVDLISSTARFINIDTPGFPVRLGLNPDKTLLLINFSNQTIGAIDIKDLPLKGMVYVRGLIIDLPIYISKDGKELLIATCQDGEYRFKTIKIEEVLLPVSKPEKLTFQNFPNPFVNQTFFCVKLSHNVESATINIYNILGQLVESLKINELFAGIHYLNWDSRNSKGKNVASGIYFARLIVNGKPIKVIKIVNIKGRARVDNQAGPKFAGIDISGDSNNSVLAGLFNAIVR